MPMQVRAYANDGKGKFKDVTSRVIPAETIGRAGQQTGDEADLLSGLSRRGMV
jgi:hypothetical protein